MSAALSLAEKSSASQEVKCLTFPTIYGKSGYLACVAYPRNTSSAEKRGKVAQLLI